MPEAEAVQSLVKSDQEILKVCPRDWDAA